MYAALILAVAGIKRMSWESRISELLDTDVSLYAVGQGALAVECRDDDEATLQLLTPLSHEDTLLCVIAERTFLKILEGGCSAPVAVESRIESDILTLKGGVWSLDGSVNVTETLQVDLTRSRDVPRAASYAAITAPHVRSGRLALAEWLGSSLARKIIAMGGDSILSQAKKETEERKLVAANVPPTK